MDSFTNQDCSHYSTAPFKWLTDPSIIEKDGRNLNPGLFIRNEMPKKNLIDTESDLRSIDKKIGKCENVDTEALDKAKELSKGLERVYTSTTSHHEHSSDYFMNNTRLSKPDESISEVSFNRFTYLPNDPQYSVAQERITDIGQWSRNEFKDHYKCPAIDNRGGNA